MFGWYLIQIRDHGILRATLLLGRVSWRRAFVILANSILPAKLACPCCGWQGRRYFDYIEMGYAVPNAACPRCDSHSRHRALFIWLRDEYRISEKSGRALVFSPERSLEPLWQTANRLAICKVDIEPDRGANVLADLVRLPFAPDAADLIWCHHVLEQVPDLEAALSELHRVLAAGGGELILSVGSSHLGETVEFGFSDKTLSGNRRGFGADFPGKLAAAGFEVCRLTTNLSKDDCLKLGILPEPFYRCTKI